MRQTKIDSTSNPGVAQRDTFYIVSTFADDVELWLPKDHQAGDVIAIKHQIAGHELNVFGNGASIDGAPGRLSTDAGDYWRLESDGTNWMVT